MKRLIALGAMSLALALGACSDDSEEPTTDGGGPVSTIDSNESREAESGIEVDVPHGWEALDPESFVYHYLSSKNNWDDVLAQRFDSDLPDFKPESFQEILEANLSADSRESQAERITYRGSVTIDGYEGFVFDTEWKNATTVSSFTYVEVDGVLWEFTVNAQDKDGLARGEAINESVTFTN